MIETSEEKITVGTYNFDLTDYLDRAEPVQEVTKIMREGRTPTSNLVKVMSGDSAKYAGAMIQF